jgi:hypothetical protein
MSSTAEVRVGLGEGKRNRVSTSNVSKVQRSRGQDGPTREERRYVGSEQMCEDEDTRRNITSITLVTLYPLARWQRPMYSFDIVLVTASKSPWSIEGDPRSRSTVGEGRGCRRREGEGGLVLALVKVRRELVVVTMHLSAIFDGSA